MNTHFKDIAKKFVRHQKGIRDPQIMHPEREWTIALVMMVAIFSGSAVWSLFVYLENSQMSLEDITVEQQPTLIYKENAVSESLDLFAEREQELQALLGTMPPVVEEKKEEPATTTAAVLENVEEVVPEEMASSTGELELR